MGRYAERKKSYKKIQEPHHPGGCHSPFERGEVKCVRVAFSCGIPSACGEMERILGKSFLLLLSHS